MIKIANNVQICLRIANNFLMDHQFAAADLINFMQLSELIIKNISKNSSIRRAKWLVRHN